MAKQTPTRLGYQLATSGRGDGYAEGSSDRTQGFKRGGSVHGVPGKGSNMPTTTMTRKAKSVPGFKKSK